ncbi:ATP-dependent zinc metalloprotease FtsH [Nostoc sp. CHAB 5834]|nr:ATP-dependent zinc metalloprotease FtsH [Nostoc sp. CHAB 5834]
MLIALNWQALTAKEVPYSEVIGKAKAGELRSIQLRGNEGSAFTRDGAQLNFGIPPNHAAAATLMQQNVAVSSHPTSESTFTNSLLIAWGPTFLWIGVFVYFMRKLAQGSGRTGVFALNKSKPKVFTAASANVRFSDVAGCDEAKEDIFELVEFLKNPEKFRRLGGSIPTGVLLSGPPGTGKTLLAKAIAGEANVPFLSVSGSDFVEMFVGVGAARVRDLFEQAKAKAPCIVFIDEIDAVGRTRSARVGGGNEEREQTLNQLLVEMDGFEPTTGVIVVAATNRTEILDKALMRPGRFDRQVTVGLPDVIGREQILNVHMRKVSTGPDVDLEVVARSTPGFSGAELANLVNEAALLTARANQRHVTMAFIEKAKDKILMGPEKRSLKMSEEERSSTAYHEAGHAVLAYVLDHTDPVHKVSIVPRGCALGVTVQLPERDRYSLGRLRILATIAVLFGGRVAEELFTSDITTGATNDYERATDLATNMVTRWGMSDLVGPQVLARFESGSSGHVVAAGGGLQEKAEGEVQRILREQYELAKNVIFKHSTEMHAMHKALMRWETIDAEQVAAIMKGQEPLPPRGSKTRKRPSLPRTETPPSSPPNPVLTA